MDRQEYIKQQKVLNTVMKVLQNVPSALSRSQQLPYATPQRIPDAASVPSSKPAALPYANTAKVGIGQTMPQALPYNTQDKRVSSFLPTANQSAAQQASKQDQERLTGTIPISQRLGSGLKSAGLGTVGGIVNAAETGAHVSKERSAVLDNPQTRALENERRALEMAALDAGPEGEAAKQRIAEIDALLAPNYTVYQGGKGAELLQKAAEEREKATEGLSGTGKFLADTGISIAQNAMQLPLALVNPAIPIATMGTSAAGQRMHELSQQGITADEALSRGALSGIIEAATEKIPIDMWLDLVRSGGKNALKSIAKQAIGEGTEEGASYVANFLADVAANDPGASFSLEELAQSMAAGAISGGVFGGVGSVVGSTRNKTAVQPDLQTPQAQSQELPAQTQNAVQGSAGSVRNTSRRILTMRENRALNALAGKAGVNIAVDDDIEGSNGYYDAATNTVHISRNANNAAWVVGAHEITHAIKARNEAEWNELYQIADKNLSAENRAALESVLSKSGYSSADMADEVVAHYVQQCVTDIPSFEQLAGVSRNLAQRIVDALESFLRKLTGTQTIGGTLEAEYLRAVLGEISPAQAQATLAQMKKALAAGGEVQGSAQGHSIKLASDGQPVVLIPTDIFAGKQGKKHEIVADYIADHIGDMHTIIESGQKVYIGKDLPKEYVHSRETQRLLKTKAKLNAKNQAAQGLGELVEIASNRQWEKNRKSKHNVDAKYGFYRYNTRFAIPTGTQGTTKIYDAVLLIRNDADGKKYLYDILDIKENSSAHLASTLNKVSYGGAQGAQAGTVSTSNYAQSPPNVNPQQQNSRKIVGNAISEEEARAAIQNARRPAGEEPAPATGNGGFSMPEELFIEPLTQERDFNREAYRQYKEAALEGDTTQLLVQQNYGKKKTKEQWVGLARQIGHTAARDGVDVNQAAYASWFMLHPNQKGNLNRQGKHYVPFEITEWVNAVRQGAIEESPQLGERRRYAPDLGRYEDFESFWFGHPNLSYAEAMDLFNSPAMKNSAFGSNTVGSAQVNSNSYAHLQNQYGTIEPGENPARVVDVPKRDVRGKKVTRGTRTIMEAAGTPDEVVGAMEQEIVDGTFSYQVLPDEKAQEYADMTIAQRGWNGALKEWEYAQRGAGAVGKNMLALGERLYIEAANNGDVDLAVKLAAEISAEATRAGQTVQAMRLLKRMTPQGQLYYLQKTVENINKENFGRKGFKDVRINNELAQKLLKSETKEDAAAAMSALTQDIADQVPVTLEDKWNAWRYLSMLGNPRTQVRNVVGNTMFGAVVSAKNALATAMETAYGVNHNFERTKAFLSPADKALRDFGKADFPNVEDAIQGGGKYNNETDIMGKRRIFKNKLVEGWRTLTNTAMEKGDTIFSKGRYADSLAQYMKANGLTPEYLQSGTKEANDAFEKARSYAILEAQKATFRDASALADFLNKTKNEIRSKARNADTAVGKVGWRAGEMLAEGILPFTKTPVNILSRGIEYSPIGLIKGGIDMVKAVRSSKGAAKAIDELAAGMTGTMICALGYFLAKGGLIKGAGEDDKEADYQSMLGEQNYAINIGGYSYTIDWAAPAALPLFVGVSIAETAENGGLSLEQLADALSTIAEPVFEMSMLQGINDAIQSAQYSSTSPVTAVVGNSITNYMGQAIPTALGQIARAIDDTSRQTYYDPNYKGAVRSLDAFGQKQLAKIPFASQSLQPRIDQWGREVKNFGGTLAGRYLYNALSPGYIQEDRTTPVDNALLDLYEESGESSVLPGYASKTFKNDGETLKLTGDQFTQLAQMRGQTAYDVLSALTTSSEYRGMSTEDKVDAVEFAYTYATYKARKDLLGDEYVVSSTYEQAQEAEQLQRENNIPIYRYSTIKAELASYTGEGSNKQKRNALMNDRSLSASQKLALDKALVSSTGESKTDYSSREAFEISQMTDSAQGKYYLIAQPSGMSYQQYISAHDAYYGEGDQTKAAKIGRMLDAGFTEAQANWFHKNVANGSAGTISDTKEREILKSMPQALYEKAKKAYEGAKTKEQKMQALLSSGLNQRQAEWFWDKVNG